MVTINDLLASVEVDEASGTADRTGVFARDSFASTHTVWQPLLPTGPLDLRIDPDYQAKVTDLILKLVRGKSYPNGNIMKLPWFCRPDDRARSSNEDMWQCNS